MSNFPIRVTKANKLLYTIYLYNNSTKQICKITNNTYHRLVNWISNLNDNKPNTPNTFELNYLSTNDDIYRIIINKEDVTDVKFLTKTDLLETLYD